MSILLIILIILLLGGTGWGYNSGNLTGGVGLLPLVIVVLLVFLLVRGG